VAASGPDGFFDSGGVVLRYVESGDGQPVVLLHSFCGNLDRDFVQPGLFAALAARYRAVAFDLRGHGKSGKPHDARRYGRELALDVLRLLDHLRLTRAHIVGYSLGAHVVAQLLSLHPRRFITATLGGAPGRRSWSQDDDKRVVLEAAELARGDLCRQILRLWPQAKSAPTEAQLRARTAEVLRGNDPKALAALRLSNPDQRVDDEALAAANVPTLGLVGSEDRYRDAFRALARVMPQLTLIEIDGATHDDALSRAEFRDALVAFLDAHSGCR